MMMSCIHNTCWNVNMYIYNSWLIIPAYIGSNIGMVRWISGTRNMRSVEMSRMLPVNLLRKDRRYPCFAKSTSEVLKIFPRPLKNQHLGWTSNLALNTVFGNSWETDFGSDHFIWDMVVLKDLSYAKKVAIWRFFGSTGMNNFLGKSWHQHRIYAQKNLKWQPWNNLYD